MTWDIDTWDIDTWNAMDEIDLNSDVSMKVQNDVSNKFKENHKLFLEKIQIFKTKNIKNTTYKYIYNRESIPLPKKGEQIRIRTQQQMNLIVIILKIIEEFEIIDELTIATYTLNREALSVITQLKEAGKIKKVNFLIASAYAFRDPKYYEEIKSTCIKHKINLIFAWMHFKITLARIGDNYYQFEGSMNYSQNNMAEQILIENNKNTYDFDYKFIHEITLTPKKAAVEVVYQNG